ncbi:hypothetical protein DESUT3_26650 [Desulfuromonas versatilis]|uniref:Uncharacterized protein n=1 Tax=Desulfuromonas versatilis TaxID=2802975 RepID=A0ABN6DZN2_9BACT|nr:hypothetical protein [Desulfuromonas versatilis]BCR05596.1 hypothetical protein DESUT3_26650 [Desulfuromonas versatilis]
MSSPYSHLTTPGPWTYGLALAAVLLLAVAVALVFLQRRRANRLFPRFNALWNRNAEPFCPRCRTALSDFQRRTSWKFESSGNRTVRKPVSYSAFQCRKCRWKVRLVDEDGFELTLETARRRLFEASEES